MNFGIVQRRPRSMAQMHRAEPYRVKRTEKQHRVEREGPGRGADPPSRRDPKNREKEKRDYHHHRDRADHPEGGEEPGEDGDRQHDLPELVFACCSSHT